MDFTRFINSRDIREYHRKIGYEYNAAEAAWLVYHCKDADVKEKHSAWKWIISNMDDYEVAERINYHACSSIKSMLNKYIELEERIVSEFYNDDPDGIYSYSSLYKEGSNIEWCEDDALYSNFETCWNRKETDDNVVRYRIRKRYLDSSREIAIEFDREKRQYISNIYYNTCLDLSKEDREVAYGFDGLWFDFPTPFTKGDIIWDPQRPDCEKLCGGPFVNTGVCLEGIENEEIRNRIIANGDETDMMAGGYFAFNNGQIYQEVTNNYMDMEFYPGKLKGALRTLIPVSSYLKGKIGLDLCIRAYHQIMMETQLEEARILDYDEEDLRSAGLKQQEN